MLINKLFLNNNHTKNPNGSLTKARNVIFDDNFEILRNEDGFVKLHDYSEDICGIIPTDIEKIVFTTDGNGVDSIYRASDSNNTLLLKGNLNLSTAYPVKGEYQYNNKGELIVAFNDTNNGIRVVNLDNLYFDIDPVTKVISDTDDANSKIQINPNYVTPTITEINYSDYYDNGSLEKGVYHFVVAYYIGDFDLLRWTYPSKPFYAGNVRLLDMKYTSTEGEDYFWRWDDWSSTTTVEFTDAYQDSSEKYSTRAIQLSLSNLDVNYSKYKLAAIYRTETTTKVFDLGDFDIGTTTHVISKMTNSELSLDEVTIPTISYKAAADITKLNDRLAVIGPNTDEVINYQKYANNIKVYYDRESVSYNDDAYKHDGLKTPILDEVYGLYICLVGKDGSDKGSFHIPGREARVHPGSLLLEEDRELTAADKEDYNKNYVTTNLNETIDIDYYYQAYNTADTFVDFADNKLAYWENRNESYPDITDFDIVDVDAGGTETTIGTLRNENVRHHKMPDLTKIHFNDIDGKATDYRINIKVTDVKFPADILEQIQGYYIAYAKRDSSNSTVLAYYPLIRNSFYETYNPATDDRFYRFNDISLLDNKPAISNPYLRASYITDVLVTDDYTSTLNVNDYNLEIRNVSTYKYLPYNNSATIPMNKGREEALIVEVDNMYDDSTSTMVCALKSNISDVFAPFYNQSLALASDITYVTSATNNYTTDTIRDFDGFISNYVSLLYRGDQTLAIDIDTEVMSRPSEDDTDPTTVIMAVDCMNNSVVNSNMKDINVAQLDENYLNEASSIAKIIGGHDYELSFKSTFNVDPKNESGITYDNHYSYVNSILPLYPRNYNNVFVNTHPHRVARSAISSKEALSLNWRYFSALEYYEMPKHRGVGVGVQGQGNFLLIHMEHSLYIAKYKDKLSMPAEGDAFIGTADIFDRTPEELIPTTYGTAGLQSRFGYCISELGYSFIDTYEKNIYNYGNSAINTLTNNSNREFFKKYLVKSEANPLTEDDVILGVDHLHNRLIVTNLGANPFTASYCYKDGVMDFISLHDYVPSLMVNNRIGTYSVNSNNLKELYKFNVGTHGTYYDGVQHDSYIDVLVHDNKPQTDKILYSVSMMSGVNDDANNIDKIFVYNRNQCSKIYDLLEMTSISDYDKIRFLEDMWNYDLIRDYSSDNIVQNIVDDFGSINLAAIDETKDWYELGDIHGRFFVIRLITNNSADMRFRDIGYNISLNRR